MNELQSQSMAACQLSPWTRLCGLCLLLGSLPWTIRLVWEMTLLTWHQGQQMVGFSIAHTMPGFLVLGVMSTLGTAIWCIGVGLVAALRKRFLRRVDRVLFAASFMAVGLQLVPYSAWQWVTVQTLGFPKLDSPAGRAMYDTMVSAAANGDVHVLQSLLARGLDVNEPDRGGTTALYAASSSGRSQTVSYLIQHGALVNLQNKDGETALHAAALRGHLESVKVLLSAGADLTIRSDGGKGFSAAETAWAANNSSIAEFLRGQERQNHSLH